MGSNRTEPGLAQLNKCFTCQLDINICAYIYIYINIYINIYVYINFTHTHPIYIYVYQFHPHTSWHMLIPTYFINFVCITKICISENMHYVYVNCVICGRLCWIQIALVMREISGQPIHTALTEIPVDFCSNLIYHSEKCGKIYAWASLYDVGWSMQDHLSGRPPVLIRYRRQVSWCPHSLREGGDTMLNWRESMNSGIRTPYYQCELTPLSQTE